ncbi:hypothetical protein ACFQZS_14345 [Mucilaginibacter calamicampi]|uniref:Uncharacterized protein n=1 Tax=Mucilaginibacter calamicampi TaxID=1302352 RepID=A0ABW2YXV2_9SPHI
MKNAIFVCLMAFGLQATAQCPINEVLTTRSPQNITNLIENNTECFKQALTQNPEYAAFKTYLDYIYNTAADWIYNSYPEKDKQFNEFYAKWGKDYPTMTSPAPNIPEFYRELAAMVAADPQFFKQVRPTKMPLRYMQWVFVKNLKQKYGEQVVVNLANAAGKLANLQKAPVYSYYDMLADSGY